MSLHYLLDGYNVIHQMLTSIPQKLEDQRYSLIHYIEQNKPQGSINNKVTIVFDGKTGITSNTHSNVVKVIFSKDETADDKIKSLVEKAKNKKSLVIVSNDRDVKYSTRALGAKTISVEEFLSQAKSFSSKKTNLRNKSNEKQKFKNISKTIEYEITSELKKIWLNKKD